MAKRALSIADFNAAMRYWKHADGQQENRAALKELIRCSFTLAQKQLVYERAKGFANKKLEALAMDSWVKLSVKKLQRAKTRKQLYAIRRKSPSNSTEVNDLMVQRLEKMRK
jgi:hypothetical protein